MNDVLPGEAETWLAFEAKVGAWLERYGYRNIRMPLVEHSLLHDGPKRLWYAGPMFRHERPQKGRYRQFHQYGVEALGFQGPDIDAELIVMCAALWRELGIEGLRLELNTIGSSSERSAYRKDLVAFLEKNLEKLDDDARRRMHTNPLRTLDSKNPLVQEVVAKAPKMDRYLGEASAAHFDGVRRLLDAQKISYRLNPKLVRGLDYYNLTVFEWVSDQLGAQGTVCGGGRYDGLFELIGGKPAPAAGFAMGNERLISLLKAGAPRPPDAYVAHQGEGTDAYALALAEELRSAGLKVVLHAGGGSFKSQMRKADASGARYALILGEDELRGGEVTVKNLRSDAAQVKAARERLLALLNK